jgi:hypothetical protein
MRSDSLARGVAGLSVRTFPVCSVTIAGLAAAHAASVGTAFFLFWMNRWLVLFGIAILALLGLKLVGDRPTDFLEWSKSALLFALNATVFVGIALIAKSSRVRRIDVRRLLAWRSYLISFFALHGLFLIVQYIAFERFSDFALLNPFGALSPPGPDPSTVELAPYNPLFQTVKRPNGLAWEPSVAALWQLCGLALLLAHPKGIRWRTAKLALIVVGVLVTRSVIADGVLVLMLVHHLAVHHAAGWRMAVFAYPALAVAGYVGLHGLADLLGLGVRLQELTASGSSGFLRYIAPVQLIEARGFSLIGDEVLGQRSFQADPLFAGYGSPLNGIANTYFESYVYFGSVGLLALVCMLAWLMAQSMRYPSIVVLIAFFPLFGGYLFNTLGLYPLVITLLVHAMSVRKARGVLA